MAQRVAAHPPRVGVRAQVAGVDRGAERLQGGPVRALQLAQGRAELAGGLVDPALEDDLVLAPLDEEAAVLERALGGDEELVHVDGLHDEVVGAELEALHRGLHVGHAGEDEKRRVGVDRAGLLEELHAVHDGHVDVGHGEGGPFGVEALERLAAVRGHLRLVPAGQEQLAEDIADVAVVVDDQHAGRAGSGLTHTRSTSDSTRRAVPMSS